MSTSTLRNYGINFYKQIDGEIKITCSSLNLAIYLNRLVNQKKMLQDFLTVLDLALKGNLLPEEDKEWTVELGLQQYTAIIKSNMTFDLFLEEYYDQTLENFPLTDIKEILQSLLNFIK